MHTVWKNEKFSLTEKIFREINSFSNFFRKSGAYTKFCQNFWERILHSAQCGNYGNSLSRIFGKNFVKVTVLLNKLLIKSWFDEIFFRWERISRFSTLCMITLWKLRNFTATIFSQKFRQINILLMNFTW